MMAPAEAGGRLACTDEGATEQRRLAEGEAARAVAGEKCVEGLLPFGVRLRAPIVELPRKLYGAEDDQDGVRQVVPEETRAEGGVAFDDALPGVEESARVEVSLDGATELLEVGG